MLICNHCGRTIEDYPTYKQTHGNSYEEEVANENCPYCNRGELVEAEKCPICDEWTSKSQLDEFGGVCDECISDYALPEYAVEYGDNNREHVCINGFIKFALTEEEINAVLISYVRKATHKFADKVKPYCLNDKSAFGEYITKTEI